MKIILQISPSLLSYSLQQFFNLIKVKTVWCDLLKQCELQDCLLNLNLLHPTFDYIWLELLIGREATPMCRGAQSGSCYHLWILDDVQLAFLCGTGCSLGTKASWGEGAPYPHPMCTHRAPALPWDCTLLLFPMQGCQSPRQAPQGIPEALSLALCNLFYAMGPLWQAAEDDGPIYRTRFKCIQ